MKIKGINPIEQHVEKLVLFVFALFAMAMFVMQFNIFGDPNAVDIGQTKHVPPAKAVDIVREQALRLDGEITGNADSAADVPTVVGPLERVQQAIGQPAIPTDYQQVAIAPVGRATDQGDGGIAPPPISGSGSETVVVVTPPTPQTALARSFGATVDPTVPVRLPEVQSLVPTDQPFDLRAVTVQATFPADALRTALAAVPEDQSVRSLPRSWWVDQVEILDVEVVRDEIGPDGAVVDTTTLPPVPGVASLRSRLSAPGVLPRDLPDILSAERASREQIRRAPFFPTIAGERWIWPALAAERDAADPDREAVGKLVDERLRVLSEIKKLEDRARINANKPPEEEKPGQNVPPPGGPQLPGGGSGGRGGPKPSGGGSSGGSQAANIEKRIADLQQRATDIETELKDKYQRSPDGASLAKQDNPEFTEAVASLTDTASPAAITVWTQDLSPEQGKTYRYRVRVWITNPLFGHGAGLAPAQQSDAESLAIASAWSDPTPPVTVYPSPAVFVSSASTGEGIGGLALRRAPSATLDLFAFYYGYWRGGDLTVSAGDQVRARISVPVLPIFRVSATEGGSVTVDGSEDGLSALPVVRDEYLVSVIPASTGSGPDLVVLANADGSVEIRQAGVDASSEAAARMRDSDAKGATAKAPDLAAVGVQKR